MNRVYCIYDNVSEKVITVFIATNDRDAKRVFRQWMLSTKQDIDFDYTVCFAGNLEFSLSDDKVFTSDEIFKGEEKEVKE